MGGEIRKVGALYLFRSVFHASQFLPHTRTPRSGTGKHRCCEVVVSVWVCHWILNSSSLF
jgi:hypothetical protein